MKGAYTLYFWIAVLSVLVCLAVGCEEETKDAAVVTFPLKEGDSIPQTHLWGWGKIPTQNNCPHCNELSYGRFCTGCEKERGNLTFIGVYCPKCEPNGEYASLTEDVTKICGECGGKRTWKYIYKDWQTELTEVNEPAGLINIGDVMSCYGLSMEFDDFNDLKSWFDGFNCDHKYEVYIRVGEFERTYNFEEFFMRLEFMDESNEPACL